jgi:hypothetical protein
MPSLGTIDRTPLRGSPPADHLPPTTANHEFRFRAIKVKIR